jgi:raffinose/stachyose/melibiose transport system permease protein
VKLSRYRRAWLVASLLFPALLIYSLFMIYPLVGSFRLSLVGANDSGVISFVGAENYIRLFSDPIYSDRFFNALRNNLLFFLIHMMVQNPIGVLLAAVLSSPRLRFKSFYRTIFFLPTMLSVTVVGFIWQLILSPLWGVAAGLLGHLGLGFLFRPWLGLDATALPTLALISVWQNVGIPMMLIYAALLGIPDELLDAGRCDGATPWRLFWDIKLPLIMPTIALASILTYIGNFNAFDLIFVTQGALGNPNFSTDLLGTFLFRTFFGNTLQIGDIHMGAAVAMAMFLVILAGVSIYLFTVQRRIVSYQL